MKNLLGIFFILPFLVGCGGSSGAATATKSIFSLWTKLDQSYSLNFSNAAVGGGNHLSVTMKPSGQCLMDGDFEGSSSSGSLTVTNSTFQVGTATSDPGCAAFNGTYTYSVSIAQIMTLCKSTCGDFN